MEKLRLGEIFWIFPEVLESVGSTISMGEELVNPPLLCISVSSVVKQGRLLTKSLDFQRCEQVSPATPSSLWVTNFLISKLRGHRCGCWGFGKGLCGVW